jgi:hypothetical protein
VDEGNGAQAGDSHVRIVRLSEVKGVVAMDRKTGQGFEPTMQNMPIIEGAKLKTEAGAAEVEFEDGSSLRVAPDSQVSFPQLLLRASGAKATTVTVERGTVYVSTEATKGNEFTLKAGQARMTLMPSTHLRLQMDGAKTAVAVIAGNVTVESKDATTLVGKKQTLTIDATAADKTELAKNVAEAPFDAWDKNSVDYHKRYAGGNAFAGSQYAFGVSDLNYYGSFVNAGGCGMMWQPYLTSASWSPYANGLWAAYPGAGYSWVSPYPWGWLPYHSGSWMQCPGVGWGWQPGNNWQGLNNVTASTFGPGAGSLPGTGSLNASRSGTSLLPVRPPLTSRSQSLVVSNSAPLVISKEKQPGQFVFERNSAGMGVPRGTLGDLNKISSSVERHGFVNKEVYNAPIGQPGQTANAGAAAHQGTPNGYSRDGHANAAGATPSSSMSSPAHSAGGNGGYGGQPGGGGSGNMGGGRMGGGAPTGGSGNSGGPHGPVVTK